MVAAANAACIDQLVRFLAPLPRDEQARIGLPWVKNAVIPETTGVAHPALGLAKWLIDIRSVAADAGLSKTWQAIVDALVVAGVRQLAPHSD